MRDLIIKLTILNNLKLEKEERLEFDEEYLEIQDKIDNLIKAIEKLMRGDNSEE